MRYFLACSSSCSLNPLAASQPVSHYNGPSSPTYPLVDVKLVPAHNFARCRLPALLHHSTVRIPKRWGNLCGCCCSSVCLLFFFPPLESLAIQPSVASSPLSVSQCAAPAVRSAAILVVMGIRRPRAHTHTHTCTCARASLWVALLHHSQPLPAGRISCNLPDADSVWTHTTHTHLCLERFEFNWPVSASWLMNNPTSLHDVV